MSLFSSIKSAAIKGLDVIGWEPDGTEDTFYDDPSLSAGGINGLPRWIPGTTIRWDTLTGNIWESPPAWVCYSWIAKNLTLAPLEVETKDTDGKFEKSPNHTLATLLQQPNPYYTMERLLFGVVLSLYNNSDAYIGIERDAYRRPAQLYWLPSGVRPYVAPGSRNFLDGYQYGGRIVPPSDIIHIPMGMNPVNPRQGMSGWDAVVRQRYSLEQGATYTANILRNKGAVGGVASPKNSEEETFDPDEYAAKYEAKYTGDGVGRIFWSDVGIDLQFPKNSPQEMALDTILDRPEADVAAIFGVPPQVVGLHVGRLSKTYANQREAREAGWEECVLPLGNLIAREIGRQLLWQTSRTPDRERVAFDVSEIRPLQPDKDALHKRAREDFMAGAYDRATWLKLIGMKPDPKKDEGVYYYMLPRVAGMGDLINALPMDGKPPQNQLPGGTGQNVPKQLPPKRSGGANNE